MPGSLWAKPALLFTVAFTEIATRQCPTSWRISLITIPVPVAATMITIMTMPAAATAVAAPAIEYQKEGQVFGIGCKIFTIAGPVILYGIFTSWVLGVVYWVTTMF